jgi:hypothetical protein
VSGSVEFNTLLNNWFSKGLGSNDLNEIGDNAFYWPIALTLSCHMILAECSWGNSKVVDTDWIIDAVVEAQS